MAPKLPEFFEPKKLTERQLGVIAFVLNSPAYSETFEPYLQSVRDSMNHLMMDRSQARKDQYPDDFLVGGIVVADGFLNFFRLLIDETDIERIHEAMQQADGDVLYHKRAQAGEQVPVLGVNQPALPAVLPPEEDY